MDSVKYFRRALPAVLSLVAVLACAPVALAADPQPGNHWLLDETGGDQAADSVAGRTAVLHNGPVFTPGRDGNALTFDGVDDFAVSDAVDVRTDGSFTVSAWVNIAVKNFGLSTAVSVDGTHTSRFRLGHVLDDDNNQFGAWTFSAAESDSDQPLVTKSAESVFPTETGTWAFLVGVHDAATHKLWLYVNGTRVGDGTLNTEWQAAGGLRIGGALAAGAPAESWPGSVDDVRLYPGVLDKDRISALYRSYPQR
ncbi:LamG domain-containing protein [Streptomyces sp. MN03-5084-2B]|nr:LamG domain-containing protein [Streptomyces sp. MN03-5084-2B]